MVGLPGSGRATQAKLIVENGTNLKRLNVGDLFRQEISEAKAKLGPKFKTDRGEYATRMRELALILKGHEMAPVEWYVPLCGSFPTIFFVYSHAFASRSRISPPLPSPKKAWS